MYLLWLSETEMLKLENNTKRDSLRFYSIGSESAPQGH